MRQEFSEEDKRRIREDEDFRNEVLEKLSRESLERDGKNQFRRIYTMAQHAAGWMTALTIGLLLGGWLENRYNPEMKASLYAAGFPAGLTIVLLFWMLSRKRTMGI